MIKKKHEDFIIGIIFMILSIGYFILSKFLPASKLMKIGPSFMPSVIACCIFILSILQIINGYKVLKINKEEKKEEFTPEYKRVLATIIAFAFYVLLLEPIGFLITTFIYLVIQMYILSTHEQRRPIIFILISLITTVVVYYGFKNGFSIMIPAGIFG